MIFMFLQCEPKIYQSDPSLPSPPCARCNLLHNLLQHKVTYRAPLKATRWTQAKCKSLLKPSQTSIRVAKEAAATRTKEAARKPRRHVKQQVTTIIHRGANGVPTRRTIFATHLRLLPERSSRTNQKTIKVEYNIRL